MNLVPSIGLTGLYTLLSPFDTALLPGTTYTCRATRTLQDIVADGVDPKAKFYTPKGLPDSAYEADFANSVCIVSLCNASGQWVYVPSSYIVSFPNMSGITYTTLSLLVKLGALPDTLNLDYLKTKIQNVVTDTIGATSSVQTVVTSLPKVISNNDHKLIEAARQAKIASNTTDSAKLAQAQATIASMTQQIRALEQYIIDKGLAP